MSITRSRSLLFKAENAYNSGKLLRSLVLALIGIGWMIDDSTTGAGGWDYKEVDWVIGEDDEAINGRTVKQNN